MYVIVDNQGRLWGPFNTFDHAQLVVRGQQGSQNNPGVFRGAGIRQVLSIMDDDPGWPGWK